MKKTAGFTLIELLVVIAIIGILSSVVLASLNTARSKGVDASIKSNLAGIRAQAEIFYDNNGHYGADITSGDCTTTDSMVFLDANITAAIDSAETSSSGGITPATCMADDGDFNVGTAASSWAISVPLKTDPLQSWCVDSTGISTLGTASIVSDLAVCLGS